MRHLGACHRFSWRTYTPELKYHCNVLFVLEVKLAKYKNEAFGRVPPVFTANMFS